MRQSSTETRCDSQLVLDLLRASRATPARGGRRMLDNIAIESIAFKLELTPSDAVRLELFHSKEGGFSHSAATSLALQDTRTAASAAALMRRREHDRCSGAPARTQCGGLVIEQACADSLDFRRPTAGAGGFHFISQSQVLYKREQFDDALSKALAAQQLAKPLRKDIKPAQACYLHSRAYSAMRQNAEALRVLNECDRLTCATHGDDSLERVPICHAMAEVHEADGKLLEMAVAARQRAPELRLAALGDAHPSYAFSRIQEAALLVRFANEALMMDAPERALADRAGSGLALAAHGAAGGARDLTAV